MVKDLVKCPKCGHEFDEEIEALVHNVLRGLGHLGTINFVKDATYISGKLDTGHYFAMVLDKDKRLLSYRREEKTGC